MNLFESVISGTGPLKIQQFLSPVISMITNVFGEARDAVRVDIYFGSIMIYSLPLLQSSPNATLGNDLIGGNNKIDKGGSFTLTIPTEMEFGSVFCSVTYSSPTISSQKFSGFISHWTLTSTVDA